MENSEIKKPIINTIVVFFVWTGCCIAIVSLLMTMIIADRELGGSAAITSILGIVLASTFGFGVAGLGIILSALSLTIGKNKPVLVKAFGITNFVLILSCLGTMAAGAILVGVGTSEVVECSIDTGRSLAWRTNCFADIGYNITIIILMVVVTVFCIIGIVNTVKTVTIINKVSPRASFVTTAPANTIPASIPQPAAATGSDGRFCSSCGAPNAKDAKFCKGCGKPC